MNAGILPSVSFLKAIAAQDGHAGYSDPLLEQQFIVQAVNAIMKSQFWKNTAIVVMYDDSDGWYDHQMSPIVNSSATDQDALSGHNKCGNGTPLNGVQGRCGYGPRLPLIVVSPFAKENFVDHSTTDQSSILRFIEDNWQLGHIDDLDHPGGTSPGQTSFDQLAGPLDNMFNFNDGPHPERVFLDRLTGEVTGAR